MVRLALPGCLILRVLSLAGCAHTYRVMYSAVSGGTTGLPGTLIGAVSSVGDVYILDFGPTESGTGE